MSTMIIFSGVYDGYEAALEKFDFERVHEYMTKVNWTWALPYESELRVPTVEEMKKSVLPLCMNALYDTRSYVGYWIECGGFRATNEGEGKIRLEFFRKEDYGK